MIGRKIAIAFGSALLLLSAEPSGAQAPDAARPGSAGDTAVVAQLLGSWSGRSVCVDKQRLPACHDEQVVYRVAPTAGRAGWVTLDPRTSSLTRDFTRNGTHGRWEFSVKEDVMEGRLVDLPDNSVARRVSLQKDRPVGAQEPSAARPDAKACAAMDAPTAAPRNHRIIFENDSVRVLDVVVGVGEREAPHAHCWPSFLYVMFRGKLREWDADGKLVREVKETPPMSSFPQTQWLDVGPPHSIENLDSQPIHLLRVEMKRQE